MKAKTVTFAKKHIYSGHVFEKGDKLTLPVDRVKALEAAGALKKESKDG
ncbi:MAG: hypothetical protein ACPGSI_17190 [Pikeienuella sp.]